MKICDYGCGKEAKYKFKNGRWCCSKTTSGCDVYRKLHRNNMLNEKNPMYGKIRIHSKKVRMLKSESMKGDKNPMYGKGYLNKLTLKKIKDKYPTFSKIEEMRYNPDKPEKKELQGHCKNHNCKNSKEQDGWFTLNKSQVSERIRQLETIDGNGGSYFYCSEKCKTECILYGKTANTLIREDEIRNGLIEDSWNTSNEALFWRQYILKLDDNLCVYCEKPATIVHHIYSRKTHPELIIDPGNGISVCKDCHYKYGHRDRWCTTGFLAKLVCERIIRIQDKVKK